VIAGNGLNRAEKIADKVREKRTLSVESVPGVPSDHGVPGVYSLFLR
jgi:hypothetical protein